MDDLATEDGGGSRWWCGVALSIAVLGLTWVSWLGLTATSEPQAGSPPFLAPVSPEAGGLFAVSLVFTALFVLATVLLVPVFSLSLVLDVRRLRGQRIGWRPSTLVWGAVSTLHLGSFVFSPVQLITVPAGLWYLYARRKHVGLR